MENLKTGKAVTARMEGVSERAQEVIYEMKTRGFPEYLDLHYNTNLEPLKIPEYGRMIQQMVDYLKTVPDREERNILAREIIRLMGLKNKSLRDIPDYQRKLWDHLFIMADFELDVDSPYPKPTPESIRKRPPRLPYPQHGYKYRYYGQIIHDLIAKAMEWDDPETYDALVMTIANHMKKNYLKWNRESVDDAIIFQHLKELSGGKIQLSTSDGELLRKDQLLRNKSSKRNYSNRNHKRRRR